MKPESRKVHDIGVALSGGGYSAAAFRPGTLHKLQQFEELDMVDVLSTISGNSIHGSGLHT